jgi:hypothetical protein
MILLTFPIHGKQRVLIHSQAHFFEYIGQWDKRNGRFHPRPGKSFSSDDLEQLAARLKSITDN